MERIFKTNLPPLDKLVILTLAKYADDDGNRCFPSVGTVAKASSLTRRGVQKIMGRQRAAGLLRPVGVRPGGTTEYQIVLPQGEGGSHIGGERHSRVRGERRSQDGANRVRGENGVRSEPEELYARMPFGGGANPKTQGGEQSSPDSLLPVSESSEKRDFCVAPSKTNGAAHEAPRVTLALNDKSEYPIMPAEVDEWQTLYPGIDVMQQLRNMRGWCQSNPKKRKTRTGILRFVNGWLRDAQNRIPTLTLALSSRSAKPESVLEWRVPGDVDQRAGEELWKNTLTGLSARMNKHSFDTWFGPTQGLGARGGTLFVRIPTVEFSHIGEKYHDLLKELLPDYSVELVPPTEIHPPQEGRLQ